MMAVPILEGYEAAVDLPSVVEEEAPMNKLMISSGEVGRGNKGSRSKAQRTAARYGLDSDDVKRR